MRCRTHTAVPYNQVRRVFHATAHPRLFDLFSSGLWVFFVQCFPACFAYLFTFETVRARARVCAERSGLSAIKIVPGAFAFVVFRDTGGTHTFTRFPGRWHGSGKQTHRETPKRWIAIAFFVPRTMMFLPTCVLFALPSKSPTAERSLVNID